MKRMNCLHSEPDISEQLHYMTIAINFDVEKQVRAKDYLRTVFSSKHCPVSVPDPPFSDIELHSSLDSIAQETTEA